MQSITIQGENLFELLTHIEDGSHEKELSVEPTYEESTKTLDVSLVALALTGLSSILTAVLIDFIKSKLNKDAQHELVFTKKTEDGKEAKLTLKNLSFEDAEQKISAFLTA